MELQRLALLLAYACLTISAAEQPDFSKWVMRHKPQGYASAAERQARSAIFRRNLERIEHVNAMERAKNGPLRLEMNGFGDMDFEEWRDAATGFAAGPDACGEQAATDAGVVSRHPILQQALDAGPLPEMVDWRDPNKNPKKINAVTPAKNQGGCGACWAFSTTGSLEGAHAIKTGELISLSEQQLIDCNVPAGGGLKSKCCSVANPKGCDCGCKGGIMSRAFRYIMSAGGIASEAAFNYTGADGACPSPPPPPAATVVGEVNISMGDINGLAAAVATQGPVSVAIDVNFCWQFYQEGGVFYGNSTGPDGKDYCSNSGAPCSSKPADLDHGVLVVGYGPFEAKDGKTWDVWYVKNSWGPGYGNKGFMLYAKGNHTGGRNIYDAGNLCGIASCAGYPLV